MPGRIREQNNAYRTNAWLRRVRSDDVSIEYCTSFILGGFSEILVALVAIPFLLNLGLGSRTIKSKISK